MNTLRSSDKRRVTRIRHFLSMSVVIAISLLSGCMMMAQAPRDLDYARTRLSQGARYRATIRPEGDSIPQHGHGLPTKPRVTRALGHGDHLVEGLKFNMGGWWIVRFRINSATGADSLVFNLKL